jgi:hypothetical protein
MMTGDRFPICFSSRRNRAMRRAIRRNRW